MGQQTAGAPKTESRDAFRVEAPKQREDYREAQQWLLTALLLVSAVLVTGTVVDRFSLPRATLYAVVTVVLGTLSLLRAVKTGRLYVPLSPALALAGVFLLALIVSVLMSEQPMRSVIGPYTRYTGFAMYAVYVALLAFVLRFHDRRSVGQLAGVFVVGLALVAGYGLLQLAGVDPVSWPEPDPDAPRLPTEFATFGNVNFAAGFVGITAPFAARAALAPRLDTWLRAGAAAVLAAAVVYAVGNGSAQGPVGIVVGTGVVALVWLVEHRRPWRALSMRARRTVGAGAVAAILAIGAATPMLASAVSDEFSDAGAREREQMWETAADLWMESPIVGHGLGAFAWEFPANRPEEHAVANNFLNADAPHNVVLAMGVGGGILLVGAYLAVVVYTGFVLVRGLRQLRGEQRLLLGAFGGAWLAYQLQSLISIDVPPLAVLHWILAGSVIVIAAPPPFVRLGVPGVSPAKKGRAARRRSARGARNGLPVPTAAAVAIGLVAIALIWAVTLPFRADLAAARADRARAVGDYASMLQHASTATDLAPWEARYWAQRAAALDNLGDPVGAREAGLEAADRDTGSAFYALAVAGLSQRLDDRAAVERWLDEALERDPHNPRVIDAVEGTRDVLDETG